MTEVSSPPGRAAKVIAFENVSKVFNQRIVLDRVSFSVASGEAVVGPCVLGRSGTGKCVMSQTS